MIETPDPRTDIPATPAAVASTSWIIQSSPGRMTTCEASAIVSRTSDTWSGPALPSMQKAPPHMIVGGLAPMPRIVWSAFGTKVASSWYEPLVTQIVAPAGPRRRACWMLAPGVTTRSHPIVETCSTLRGQSAQPMSPTTTRIGTSQRSADALTGSTDPDPFISKRSQTRERRSARSSLAWSMSSSHRVFGGRSSQLPNCWALGTRFVLADRSSPRKVRKIGRRPHRSTARAEG